MTHWVISGSPHIGMTSTPRWVRARQYATSRTHRRHPRRPLLHPPRAPVLARVRGRTSVVISRQHPQQTPGRSQPRAPPPQRLQLLASAAPASAVPAAVGRLARATTTRRLLRWPMPPESWAPHRHRRPQAAPAIPPKSVAHAPTLRTLLLKGTTRTHLIAASAGSLRKR